MYFITVFENIELDVSRPAILGNERTWGYYPENEKAATALHENITDLHEGCYDYAIIEKIGPGICADVTKKQWFKWNKEKRGYFEIDAPEWARHRTNFAIG